ncbi:MAG: hypothetical protein LIO69_03045 [Oscillospiraceae bacterium]|nr:hypothetical protein [Oscillospiraceae bacterium]
MKALKIITIAIDMLIWGLFIISQTVLDEKIWDYPLPLLVVLTIIIFLPHKMLEKRKENAIREEMETQLKQEMRISEDGNRIRLTLDI